MSFYLREMCCLCLSVPNVFLHDVNSESDDKLTHFDKLSSTLSRLTTLIETDFDYKLCERCCDIINMIYEFNEICFLNLNRITTFRRLLKQKSNQKESSLSVTLKRLQNVEIGKTIYLSSDDKIYSDRQLNNDTDSEGLSVMDSDSNFSSDVTVKEDPDDLTSFDDDLSIDNSEECEVKIEIEEHDVKKECLNGINGEIDENRNQNLDADEGCSALEKKNTPTSPDASTKRDFLSPRNKNIIQKTKTQEDGKNIKQEEYRCDICNKVFTRKNNLNAHKKRHTVIKLYECHICLKTFANINQHMLIHSGIKAHKCEICKKSFSQKRSLEVHKLVHIREKLFSCDVCERAFRHKWTLTLHKRVHTGDLFTCEVCQQSFTTKYVLDNHKLTHNKKSFQCDICDKQFTSEVSVRKHKLKHTGGSHYCEVCHKTFIQESHLVEHKRIHSGEKL